jgi:hypothetical protein
MKTKGKTSPKNSSRGCLCHDNTYSRDCCNGDLRAQGIGSLQGQGTVILVQEGETQHIVVQRG